MGFENATFTINVLIGLFLLCFFYYSRKIKKNDNLYIRKIAGIDAIEDVCEIVGETGRPVSFTTGTSDIGPVLYASLGVLNHVAKKAGTYKNRLLIPQYYPEVMAVVEEAVKDSYESISRLNYFDKKDIRFLSNEQFAYTSGYIGMIKRENVCACFLFGSFSAESLILAEAGQEVGALQVAATTSPEQVAFFIASCDYTLIGEELFGAASYLTRNNLEMSCLYTQDRTKLFFFCLIIIGSIIATINQFMPENPLLNIDTFLGFSFLDWKDFFGKLLFS